LGTVVPAARIARLAANVCPDQRPFAAEQVAEAESLIRVGGVRGDRADADAVGGAGVLHGADAHWALPWPGVVAAPALEAEGVACVALGGQAREAVPPM
jgi:hypothetical protein